jgi:glycosyltransferase involved in cell wall biosynthesis
MSKDRKQERQLGNMMRETMKVCMISGLAEYSGGVENVVKELSNDLVNRKVGVTVFGMSNRNFVREEGNCKTVGVRPFDILPRRLRVAYSDKLTYSLKVWRKTCRSGSFDIIHGHADNCLFPSLFRNKTPFIMTFHGTRGESPRRDPRLLISCYAEKVAASKCDLAVACSNAIKEELISLYGAKAGKIAVVHNGVDVEKFTPQDKNQAKLQLGLPTNLKYALWVGADPKRKGLNLAMEAVDAVPNVHLLVVGLSRNNSGKTIFLGRVSEADLIAAYNAAECLIFPTVKEGFPVAPMEALACRLPIIASKESNMGEIATSGVHGFIIENRNKHLYAEKIRFMLNDADALKRMSEECRLLAEKYSWQRQAEKYWKLYMNLLKRPLKMENNCSV